MITCSLHNHCTLCDGKSTPKEMVESAVKAGITDFGFSSHAFVSFDPEASIEREQKYIDTLKSFIASDNSGINLYLGLENDLFASVNDKKAYDYIIGSVHYIKRNDKYYPVDYSAKKSKECIDEVFGGNELAFCKEYYSSLLTVAKQKPDILGHFDLITKFGNTVADFSSKEYISLATDYLDECIKQDVIFEINYGAIARGYTDQPYPSRFLLDRLKEKNAKVIVTTDCHDASKIALGLNEGEELLKAVGFKEITVLRLGKWTQEKLR